MNIKDMTIDELEARKTAIVAELDSDGADLDALEAEARSIKEELESRKAIESQKAEIREQVAQGSGEVIEEIKIEERKIMTDKEIRSSKEYIDAYVDYIKGKNDGSECRQLLTDNAVGGVVPVPTYVEGRIQTAWENDEIMSRVRKTFVKGNYKIGVEISTSDASLHAEGDTAPDPEEFVIALVNLIPGTVKKWLLVSSEAMDLTGTEFLDYLYDEIIYKIVKMTAEGAIDAVTTAPTTPQTPPAPMVSEKAVSALALDDIVTAIGLLSGNASNLCFIANRATIAAYQALALGANYSIDIWGGATVIATDALPSFASANANDAFAIVGDLSGITANYPAGDEVKFIYDEYSYAESDMIKLVGRQMVGIGLTKNNAFTVLKKTV